MSSSFGDNIQWDKLTPTQREIVRKIQEKSAKKTLQVNEAPRQTLGELKRDFVTDYRRLTEQIDAHKLSIEYKIGERARLKELEIIPEPIKIPKLRGRLPGFRHWIKREERLESKARRLANRKPHLPRPQSMINRWADPSDTFNLPEFRTILSQKAHANFKLRVEKYGPTGCKDPEQFSRRSSIGAKKRYANQSPRDKIRFALRIRESWAWRRLADAFEMIFASTGI